MKAIVNARLVLHDHVLVGSLLMADGVIRQVGDFEPPPGAEVFDAARRYVAPGFIDIHVHGGGGHSLMTDDPEEVRAFARWAVQHGVTSFLVSTAAPDHERLLRRLEACVPAMGSTHGGAEALGFHLEGPFINPKRRGAFDASWLRPPDAAAYRELADAARGHVRQVTLAPELPGAERLIDSVQESGAVPAMGHTDADDETARRAVRCGVRHVTHTFNAMRPFMHRDPGCLGVVFTEPSVTAELIGDGAHVHPVAGLTLVRTKGVDGVVLVTDGIPLAGAEEGEATWAGMRVRIEGGKAVRSDGVIVGGVTTLDRMVANAVAWFGVTLPEAVRMASLNPAAAIGVDDHKGSLAAGKDADVVVLDDDLRVLETYVRSEHVYTTQALQRVHL